MSGKPLTILEYSGYDLVKTIMKPGSGFVLVAKVVLDI